MGTRDKKAVDVREQARKKIAEQFDVSEELVRTLESFQWKSIQEAVSTCSMIDIDGIGRLMTRMNIVGKKLVKYTAIRDATIKKLEATEKESEDWYPLYKRSKSAIAEVEFLENKKDLIKPKLKNEPIEDLGGDTE